MGILSTALGIGRDILLINERLDGLAQDLTDVRRDMREQDRRIIELEVKFDLARQRALERRRKRED